MPLSYPVIAPNRKCLKSNAAKLSANLYLNQSLDIERLKLAKNWEKAIYTKAKWDDNNFRLIPIDELANKAKIEEIRDLTEGYVKF